MRSDPDGVPPPARGAASTPAPVGDLGALAVPDETYAGILAFYSIIHLAPGALAPAFREWARALRPGGLALVAFHVADAECALGAVRRLAEWWGHAVEVDFHFFAPETVTEACAAAGLTVEAVLRRAPYTGAEHASERGYVLACKAT